jgi:hypothetical protein
MTLHKTVSLPLHNAICDELNNLSKIANLYHTAGEVEELRFLLETLISVRGDWTKEDLDKYSEVVL